MGRPVNRLPALNDAWRDRAACKGMDTDMWFPTETDARPNSEAQAICRACPVRVECAEYALAADERYGMWGGLTVDQLRRKLPALRRPPEQACGDKQGTITGYDRHRKAAETTCQPCRTALSDYRRSRQNRDIIPDCPTTGRQPRRESCVNDQRPHQSQPRHLGRRRFP